MKYIRDRLMPIIIVLSLVITFAAVFYLYGAKLEAVMYASFLCLLFSSAIAVIDAARLRERRRTINNINKLNVPDISALPTPDTSIERGYMDTVTVLSDRLAEITSESARREGDMSDYYTLWAHQIKTPIAAMRLLLQSGASAREIEAELFRIEQYVDMALNYIRADSETKDLVLRNTDIDEVIKRSVRKYSKLFILKKISLKYTETKLICVTDEKWLAFIIEQIISNALKYTNRGEITISKCGDCSISIEDTGIGISEEDIPRVFDKGYTGYTGRGDKKATGIGLYLVKKVCAMLNHDVTLASVQGKGTKVTIDLARRDMPIF